MSVRGIERDSEGFCVIDYIIDRCYGCRRIGRGVFTTLRRAISRYRGFGSRYFIEYAWTYLGIFVMQCGSVVSESICLERFSLVVSFTLTHVRPPEHHREEVGIEAMIRGDLPICLPDIQTDSSDLNNLLVLNELETSLFVFS